MEGRCGQATTGSLPVTSSSTCLLYTSVGRGLWPHALRGGSVRLKPTPGLTAAKADPQETEKLFYVTLWTGRIRKMNYKGKAHKVGEHIDTDAIIPARFLVTSDSRKLGENCMSGLEPDWAKRVSPGDIMVAGRNFGCGSSREHAPIAILGAGMPVVIGHSFARIFYRNSFNMGLLLMEVGDEVDKISDGDELEIDAATGLIRDLTNGAEITCPPLPASMSRILDKGGLVNYVKERIA